MRLFLAINMADDIKIILNNNLKNFKQEINNGLRWVKKDNMHITLKFLGELKKDMVGAIVDKIDFVAGRNQQQSTMTGGIAAFPHLNYPRVIYIKLREGANHLVELHTEVENELIKLGFKADRDSYMPHITVARTKNNTKQKNISIKLKKYIKSNKDEDISDINIVIKSISLMKSTLKKNGPVYEEIYTAELINY